MAQSISLTSGSILNGSPITVSVQPSNIGGAPTFHRVILEIECGMTGGNYEVIKMSATVPEESSSVPVVIDISSALRTFRDSYEYTPEPVSYPVVRFNLHAYDEYMLDGDYHPKVDSVWFPSEPETTTPIEQAYLGTIFGRFSDLERLISGGSKGVKRLSKKPPTPQIAVAGDMLIYPQDYATEQLLTSLSSQLTAPYSTLETLLPGIQTIAGQTIYAIPSTDAHLRQTFRFINSFGVLESISLPRAHTKQVTVKTTQNIISRPETFNTFTRAAIQKRDNREPWLFTTDPLDEEWLSWYIHEFLMSEHVWLQLSPSSPVWLPVIITTEETTTFLDRNPPTPYTLSFTATPALNGPL